MSIFSIAVASAPALDYLHNFLETSNWYARQALTNHRLCPVAEFDKPSSALGGKYPRNLHTTECHALPNAILQALHGSGTPILWERCARRRFFLRLGQVMPVLLERGVIQMLVGIILHLMEVLVQSLQQNLNVRMDPL